MRIPGARLPKASALRPRRAVRAAPVARAYTPAPSMLDLERHDAVFLLRMKAGENRIHPPLLAALGEAVALVAVDGDVPMEMIARLARLEGVRDVVPLRF